MKALGQASAINPKNIDQLTQLFEKRRKVRLLISLTPLLLALVVFMVPTAVGAFRLGEFFKTMFGEEFSTPIVVEQDSTISAARTLDPRSAVGGAELLYEGENALLPVVGPLGNIAEADGAKFSQITTYTVREGDSIGFIAQTFNVSQGTIVWANDLKGKVLREGQQLIILPITGLKYTVKKGDTISTIAKKFKGDESEIFAFNDLAYGASLTIGQVLVIPNVDPEAINRSPSTSSIVTRNTARFTGGPNIVGYYIRPFTGGVKTQGLHGYNGVDLAAPCGTPLYASASGTVVIARQGGWNAGYGNYVVIAHTNKTQTVYGHMKTVMTSVGAYVAQGQQIGTLGNSGNSTGCHVHFEIRGAKNPF